MDETMTYAIGDPNHLGVHNDLVTAAAAQAARFGITVTLPDTAHLGDTGHVDDHNLLAAALAAIVAAPSPGIPWAEISGGTVTTDGTTTVHTFTANGTLTVTKSGYVDSMVCGAGAGGQAGTYPSAGGGGGVRAGIVWLPAGTYPVTVGAATTGTQSGGGSSLGSVLTVGGGWHNANPSGQGIGGGGGGPSNGNVGNSGSGGAGGPGTASAAGPGVVWHGVEYGRGNRGSTAPTTPGQGGMQGANGGLAGAVVARVG